MYFSKDVIIIANFGKLLNLFISNLGIFILHVENALNLFLNVLFVIVRKVNVFMFKNSNVQVL